MGMKFPLAPFHVSCVNSASRPKFGQRRKPARIGPHSGQPRKRDHEISPADGMTPAGKPQLQSFATMALTIPEFYPNQFDSTWQQELQQPDSRLLPAVTRADFTGKKKAFNLITARTANKITTRKGNTPDGEFDGNKYWLTQSPYELPTTFDEWDQTYLGQIILPTSEEFQAHRQAFNRAIDDAIIDAFDGTRYIGEDGTTPDTFPGGQSIAVDYVESGSTANSGLTIAKLRRVVKIMDEDEVPVSDRFIAVTAQEKQDLLRTTEVTNADYNTVRALASGQIDTFLGLKFIHTERLPINAGTDVTSVFAWHKSGIKFSMHGLKAYMDVLPTRRHALQLRTTAMFGSVRVQNEYVVRVYCDRSPA